MISDKNRPSLFHEKEISHEHTSILPSPVKVKGFFFSSIQGTEDYAHRKGLP